MRIAYFLLVHQYPHLFKRMFRAIYAPENVYLVHIDKKSTAFLHQEIRSLLSNYPNVRIMQPRDCIYCGYSMVDIELKAIEELLDEDWDFFMNLSGQDFPLQTQGSIRDYLTGKREQNFVHIIDVDRDWAAAKFRTQWYFVEYKFGSLPIFRRKRVWPLPIRTPYPTGYKEYGGSQWFTASRRFCEYVCRDPEVDKLKRYYKHTYIPDEHFFQAAIMHSPFRNTVINDNKRLIQWRNKRIHTFTMADRETLATSEAFFARKFDETVDGQIVDYLEARLNRAPAFDSMQNQ
jgi:Core-2/I-Branching enzyme